MLTPLNLGCENIVSERSEAVEGRPKAARLAALENWDDGNEQKFLKTTTDDDGRTDGPPKVTRFYGVIPEIVAFFHKNRFLVYCLFV